MSKIRIVAVLVLTTALAGAAYAAPGRGGGGGGGGRGGGGGPPHAFGGGGHFGGGGGPHFGGGQRFGGAPRFAGRPAISRYAARPSFRSQRSFAVHSGLRRTASGRAAWHADRSAAFSRNHNAAIVRQNRIADLKSNAVRTALNSHAVAGAMHNRGALRNPNMRAQIVASAATAGWLGGHHHGGWWRHGHGGYGWVGPLFWPFAFYDIYDYAMWGYGYDPLFWDYGYSDIYAGLFAPYGYEDLVGYLPPGGTGTAPRATAGQAPDAPAAIPDQLAQMCGEDSRDIAGLPIDQIQQAIQPNDAERAALDDLANASAKAAQTIKAACPTRITLTAPGRLAAMQQRIEAMMAAVETVQPPLQKFYDLLNDEQKARLNSLGEERRKTEATDNKDGSRAQSCNTAQPGLTEWPTAAIEARLRPTEEQRASLAALKDASAKAADMLKISCETTEAITPPARLEATGKRLDVMLRAVKSVRAALDDFYGKLSDEQKAQFEAIGPRRTALSSEPGTESTRVRHRHRVGVGGLIRHFMSLARW
jgi:hypothetical protein